MTSLQHQLESTLKERKELVSTIHKLKADVLNLESQLSLLSAEHDGKKEEVESCKISLADVEENLKQSKKACEKSQTELNQFNRWVTAAMIEFDEPGTNTTDQLLRSLSSKSKSWKHEKSKFEEEIKVLIDQNNKLSNEKKVLEERKRKLEEEKQNLKIQGHKTITHNFNK